MSQQPVEFKRLALYLRAQADAHDGPLGGDNARVLREWAAQVERLQAERGQVVPVYQYQKADGSWIDQDKGSYDYNVKHGAANVRVVYTSPPAVAQAGGADERAAFEAWESDNGKWPKAIERDAVGRYKLMQASSAWIVWQARAALAAQPARVAMLTALQYNQIPELCAIKPSLYESVVRAIEREFCRINGLTAGITPGDGRAHG